MSRIHTSTLMVVLALLAPDTVVAEENRLSIGSVRTVAEEAALSLLLKYKEQLSQRRLGERFTAGGYYPGDTHSSFVLYTPSIDFQAGDGDAFNGIVMKAEGTFARFRVTCLTFQGDEARGVSCDTPGAVPTPGFDRFFSAMPFSVGIETDSNFDNVNAIAEIGYVPFNLGTSMKWGLKNKVGIFLQGGYKFEVTDDQTVDIGGASDESMEKPDDTIARLKSVVEFALPVTVGDLGTVSLEPLVHAWYDIENSEIYHKAEFRIVFELSEDIAFDFKFEDGSGAPNFNEGDQFSANLSLHF